MSDSKEAPHLFFTVTNHLATDQRMQRICGSLALAGYKVTLVGRHTPDEPPLPAMPFEQVRLPCKYQKGKLFYIEFGFRLYQYLKKQPADAICAIDLDTIVPVFFTSRRKKIPRVYDAHELFTELTEVKRRPLIYRIWLAVERYMVPRFTHGYTVNHFIAGELNRRYGVNYQVVRNVPKRIIAPQEAGEESRSFELPAGPFFLYQGAVNEGRCFETLIPAMKMVDASLVIAGEGNFFQQAKDLVRANGLSKKVRFLGNVAPEKLRWLTPKAYAGITLFGNTGLNQYYSLANRFFDYINAGIPQLCVGYPEYEVINKQYEIALLTTDISSNGIANSLNNLLNNKQLHNKLQANCAAVAANLCWENEEKKLLLFWRKIIPAGAENI